MGFFSSSDASRGRPDWHQKKGTTSEDFTFTASHHRYMAALLRKGAGQPGCPTKERAEIMANHHEIMARVHEGRARLAERVRGASD